MGKRQYDNEEPPMIPGYESEGRVDQPGTGIQRVLGDPRAMLALPMLAAMLVTMPALSNTQRADLAWDQIDALLAVRKQRREAYYKATHPQ